MGLQSVGKKQLVENGFGTHYTISTDLLVKSHSVCVRGYFATK